MVNIDEEIMYESEGEKDEWKEERQKKLSSYRPSRKIE